MSQPDRVILTTDDLDLMFVPAGHGWMGADDALAEPAEKPLRQIELREFLIQRSPVTFTMWRAFCEATGYRWNPVGEHESEIAIGPSAPATLVSWNDATAFARWAGDLLKIPLTLPTTLEWEYACRGTSRSPMAGGVTPEGMAHWAVNPESLTFKPSTIGQGPEQRSWCGCLDMWMCVAEWCADAPADDATMRSICGGNPANAGWPRASRHSANAPAFRHPQLGFRLVSRAHH